MAQEPQGLDRTNPDMYGPEYARRPMADTIAPIKDALESLTPEEKYLIDSTGETVSRRVNSSMLFKQALQTGETTSSLTQQVQAAEAADAAYKLAEQASSLSDQEFQQAMQELQNEMQGGPQMPVPGQVQQPDRLSQALAAIFSVATPEHAFSIGAVPYQNQMRIRDENYQIQLKQYGADIAQRDDRIKIAELKLKMAAQNREESSQRLYQMAAEASRRGEAKRAAGLKARGDLASAKSLTELKDQIQVMRENFPDMLPDKEVLDGYRNQLELGAKAAEEKAKLELDKEERTNLNSLVDNFRQSVNSMIPADRAIGPTEQKAIKDFAVKFASENGIKLNQLPWEYPTRDISPALGFQQQKYQDEAPTRAQDYKNKVLEGEIKATDLEKKRQALTEGPPSKDKADKRKRLNSLNTKIDTAKIAVDSILQQPVPEDPDERAKYFAKLRDAFTDELATVQLKRKEAGGKAPTINEYIEERFPGFTGRAVSSMFGPIGVAKAGSTKSKPVSDKEKKQLGKGGSYAPVLPKGVTG